MFIYVIDKFFVHDLTLFRGDRFKLSTYILIAEKITSTRPSKSVMSLKIIKQSRSVFDSVSSIRKTAMNAGMARRLLELAAGMFWIET
jgi:hypothetical protein